MYIVHTNYSIVIFILVFKLVLSTKNECSDAWNHFTNTPPDTPITPNTPATGKGLWGVTKSVPVPLPPYTLHQYPGGFENPCPSLVSALLWHPILLFPYILPSTALLSCTCFYNIPKSFPASSNLNAFPNVSLIIVLLVHTGTTLFFGNTLWYIPKSLVHECHLLTISLYQTCLAPVTLKGLIKHENWHLNTPRGYTTVLRKVPYCPFHARGNKAKSAHALNHHRRPPP